MEKIMANGRRFLEWNQFSDQEIEYFEINILEQNTIPGLMTFEYVHANENKSFRYEWSETSLGEWLEDFRSKKEVLCLLESLAEGCAEAQAWLLDERKLVFSLEDISVERSSGKCKLAYLPLLNRENQGVQSFVRDLLGHIQYKRGEDYLYLFDLQNAFSRGVIHEKEDLLRWIRNEREKEEKRGEIPVQSRVPQPGVEPGKENPVAAAMPAEREGLKKSEKKEKRSREVRQKNTKDILPLPEGMLLPEGVSVPGRALPRQENVPERQKVQPEKKKAFPFGRKENERENVRQAEPVQKVNRVQPVKVKEELAETMFVGNSEVSEKKRHVAQLVSRRSRTAYRLEKDRTLIGSDRETADICISGNRAVSRRHAWIFKRGGSYYLGDAGSKNGTFLENRRINAGQEVILRNGAVIAFANEEFVFSVQG